MKRTNLKEMGNSLSRAEMREILGGKLPGGGGFDDGGGVPCPTTTDCTVNGASCPGTQCAYGTGYCAKLSCTPSWGGVYTYLKCSC